MNIALTMAIIAGVGTFIYVLSYVAYHKDRNQPDIGKKS